MSFGYNSICRLIFSIASSISLLPKNSSAVSLSGDVTGGFVVDGRTVGVAVGVAVGATVGVALFSFRPTGVSFNAAWIVSNICMY